MKKHHVFLLLLFLVVFLVVYLQRSIFQEDHLPYSVLFESSGTPVSVYLPIVSKPYPYPKAGVGWAAYGQRSPQDDEILKAAWCFNWSISRSHVLADACGEYVPMFWSDKAPALVWPIDRDFFVLMDNRYGFDYSGKLLFSNEPDLRGSTTHGTGQADMTPRQTAYLYASVVKRYPNAQIVGPCPSHLDYVHGWVWLDEFYRVLSRLDVPFPSEACLHTYIFSEHPSLIVESMLDLLLTYDGAPQTLWVTEFGSCDTTWAKEAILYFQKEDAVTRYAWFTPRGWNLACINLFKDPGSPELTPVGEVWQQLHP